jgi:hypothetical protein
MRHHIVANVPTVDQLVFRAVLRPNKGASMIPFLRKPEKTSIKAIVAPPTNGGSAATPWNFVCGCAVTKLQLAYPLSYNPGPVTGTDHAISWRSSDPSKEYHDASGSNTRNHKHLPLVIIIVAGPQQRAVPSFLQKWKKIRSKDNL